MLEYDIVQSDDTGIQVLEEPGRAASTRSALWIRRGGPPGRAAVLVDYRETKSAAVGATLLEGVRARTYLVVDAAQSFEAIARIHDLVPVLCNDHARRKFVEAARGGVPGSIAGKAIAFYKKLYRIELAFREMKSHYRLEQMPSRKPAVVEALVLTSLITMMVSKQLLEAVRQRLQEKAGRLREERWAALLASVAADVLDVVLLPARAAGVLARRLEPMLLHEAIDPNAKRKSLLQRVDQETVWSR